MTETENQDNISQILTAAIINQNARKAALSGSPEAAAAIVGSHVPLTESEINDLKQAANTANGDFPAFGQAIRNIRNKPSETLQSKK